MLQMQRAIAEVFSNRHGPDKLVVVVDAAGTDSLQAARNAALLKQVAVALNKVTPLMSHHLRETNRIGCCAACPWKTQHGQSFLKQRGEARRTRLLTPGSMLVELHTFHWICFTPAEYLPGILAVPGALEAQQQSS